MNYKQVIIRNIKKYCQLKGLSFSALARKAKLPLRTLQTILYDKRYKEPRLSNIHALAKALKVPLDSLIK